MKTRIAVTITDPKRNQIQGLFKVGDHPVQVFHWKDGNIHLFSLNEPVVADSEEFVATHGITLT